MESTHIAARSQKALIRRIYDDVNRQARAHEGVDDWFLNLGYHDPATDGRVPPLPPLWAQSAAARLAVEVIGECPLAGRHAVDVGCGRGGTVRLLHDVYDPATVTGLDLSWTAIEFCQRTHHVGGVSFRCGDAEHLPWPDGSVEVVVNIESSHCYPNVERFYGEVARVLAPGGRFLYADLFHREAIAARRAALAAAGLAIERDRDITAGVVAACGHTAGRSVEPFQGPLGTVLGKAGAATHQGLRDGSVVYGVLTLQR